MAPGLTKEIFESKIKKYAHLPTGETLPIALCRNRTYEFLNICDFVLVASGTATLETAIMQKPMVVVYKVSFLNWFIAKWLIKLPFIGLVNVVAGKKIIPEFIQYKAQPHIIAQKTWEILTNQEKLAKIKTELKKVRQNLGTPGASERAAEIIINFVC
jgi:lipid-A-disaccharide synthase